MLYNLFKISTVIIFTLFVINQPVLSAPNDLTNLNTLETQFFNQNFTNEPVTSRLDRVERVIFGKTYTENENNRIERLAAFAKNPKQPIKQKNNDFQNAEDSTGFAAEPADYTPKDDSATDYPVVTMLEDSAFQRDYKGENVYLRLNRLESKVFGTTFPQDSLYTRVDKLKSVLTEAQSNDNNTRSSQRMNTTSVFANLSSLELTVFNETYDGEAVQNRLSRLESKVFGSIQPGNAEIRLAKLNQNIENSFASTSLNNNDYSYSNLGGMNENYSSTTTTAPTTPGGTGSAAWEIIKSLLFNFLSGGSGYNSYNGYGAMGGYGGFGGPNYYSPMTGGYSGYGGSNSYYNRSINNNLGTGVRILP